jgi:hypothetical protein
MVVLAVQTFQFTAPRGALGTTSLGVQAEGADWDAWQLAGAIGST